MDSKIVLLSKGCPNKVHMGKHACLDKGQCFEPCGELGHDADYAEGAPEASLIWKKGIGITFIEANS